MTLGRRFESGRVHSNTTGSKDNRMLGKIKLESALVYTCPVCGKENFEHMMPMEMTPAELAEIHAEAPEMFPENPKVGIHFEAHPDQVTCQDCGGIFDVDHGDEDD
jgi:rubredoxin